MGLRDRTESTLRVKLDALLDELEDPKESREYTYERLDDELAAIKESVVDLVTEKKRLERRRDRLEATIEERNRDAREAVRAGRDDLARDILRKKTTEVTELDELEGQIDDLESAQKELVDRAKEMERRVSRYRAERARLDAEEAAARAEGVASGDPESAPRTADAMDEIDEQEARAAALEELEESGFFGDGEEDDPGAELDRVQAENEIEDELATLRAEMGVDDDEEGDEAGAVDAGDGEDDGDDGGN
ncbi:PspA/IM30 family protein [Halobium salinum]|uniref:PspA/IM30 family protein n=1 Tax=Halobium salinum TaxID=1364940 RepID=A0ABD5PCY1_9EURY|nr:PspA/IM30 family protein [Halobium salinum]